MDDRSQQPVSTLTFSDFPEDTDLPPTKSRKLHLFPASSEISASVVDNPLESSVEMGVDIAMSSSQNSTVSKNLMSQHLGGDRTHPHTFQWSENSSAFFKPIASEGQGSMVETSETDEEKTKHVHLIKPSILINDSERLSPKTPPHSKISHTHPAFYTGMVEPIAPAPQQGKPHPNCTHTDSKQHVDNTSMNGLARGQRSPSISRSRSESITKLQQLQQRINMPRLAGTVSGRGNGQG